MKSLVTFSALMLFAFLSVAQTTLYSTDFTSPTGWSLEAANNFDTWVINSVYSCSTPTPDQSQGNYLHIYDDLDGETCAYAGFFGLGSSGTCYATMTTGFSTVGQTEVKISFDWLCKGQTGGVLPSYGTLEYSTDGNIWTKITNPVNQYSGQSSWTNVVVSSNNAPSLLNQSNVKIRFGWVSSGYGTNPAFAIDNLLIQGFSSCVNIGGTINQSEPSICAGKSVSLDLTGSIGSIQWQDSTVGGHWTNVSGTSINFVSASLSESRFFRAVLSQNGCPNQYSNTASVEVIPAVLPVITVFPQGEGFYCEGDTIQLSAETEHGGATPEIFWLVGTNRFNSSVLQFSVGAEMNGSSITAFLVSSEKCASVDTVNSEPIALLVISSPEVSLNLPDSWCKGDGTQSLDGGLPEGGLYGGIGVEGSQFNLNQEAGEYFISYQVTDENGCRNTALDTVTIDLCTSLLSLQATDIRIFPNPADERGFEISLDGKYLENISIYSLDGRLIREINDIPEQKVRIQGLTPGLYLVKIDDNQRQIAIPVVIQ